MACDGRGEDQGEKSESSHRDDFANRAKESFMRIA